MAKPALKTKIAPKPAKPAREPVVATTAKNPRGRGPDAAFDMKGKLAFPVSERVQVVLDDSTYTPAGKKPVRSIGLTKVVLNENGHYYAVARVAIPAGFFTDKKAGAANIEAVCEWFKALA
jgi:hypothetical protein